MTRFADILLSIPLPPFTYAIPEGMELERGVRVRVPLGRTKMSEGIVWRIHNQPPARGIPKPVGELIDPLPVVTPPQMRLWEWVSDYYLCPLGDILKTAVPLGIRRGSYRPPTRREVRLPEAYHTDEALHELLDRLRRSKAQRRVVEALAERPEAWVPRTELPASSALLKGMIDRELLETRNEAAGYPAAPPPDDLSTGNLSEIVEALSENKTLLVSGLPRTDRLPLYRSATATDGQSLILFPDQTLLGEVARTWNDPGTLLFHPHLSEAARSAAYYRMLTAPGSVRRVAGTRSALFLPFHNLQRVVIDNEQEPSYRQSDPSPRFHGRDSALMLAQIHHAHTLLAGNPPSLESWLNARQGKYALHGPLLAPSRAKITLLERGKGLFSTYLQRQIEQTLARGEQVVLLQNRRGFAPFVSCPHCGYVPCCPHCNVSLSYHKEQSLLRCHYCGFGTPYVAACPSCKLPALEPHGFGTQQIEEELGRLFPMARVVRLDTDSASSQRSRDLLLSEFSGGRGDILVGTQLVTRTPALDRVALVGVLQADALLIYPDFRTDERAFQLLAQLRGMLAEAPHGELVIQASRSNRTHPVLAALAAANPESLYAAEAEKRQQLHYPPFFRMVRFTLRHTDPHLLRQCAEAIEALLRPAFGERLSPPFEPQIDRLSDHYILHLLLRVERSRSFEEVRREILRQLAQLPRSFRSVARSIEVDPL